MRQGGHRILCETIISQPHVVLTKNSSHKVIKTKNKEDTFYSATAPTLIAIHPILSPATARE
jgi:hypothetical protein